MENSSVPCSACQSLAFVSHIPLRPINHTVHTLKQPPKRPRVQARTDYDDRRAKTGRPTRVRPSIQTERKVYSPGETPPSEELFPPGRLPLALELNFVLNHPATESFITALVIVNCFAFALQTIDVGPLLHQAFHAYENNVSVLFLLEYFARWYGKGFSPRFLLTRKMIIDFLAVAPIGFAVVDQSEAIFVRLLRLTRIFRLERMVMDSESREGMMKGMTNVQIQLAGIGLSLFSLLYVSAGLFYQVEKDINPEVRNFFDAFYYSTITLFTVGFGDVTPLTGWGRLVTVLTVLCGAVLIPFKLSEVERVRKLVRREEMQKNFMRETGAPPSGEFQTPMSSTRIECSKCHLRGHQVDARFCRNCGHLLSKRIFDT